jgi:predicted MPP superfamily phosphohydrolase
MLGKTIRFLLFLAGALVVYAVAIEPNRMVVREVRVPSERLNRFFDGATVVQISDLHVAGIGLRERRLVAALRRVRPDYVFVTGDFVRMEEPYGPVLDLLARIEAPGGVYGVLGNVDNMGSRESCRMCHETGPGWPLRTGGPIRMLRNESVGIERRGERLLLIGLDEWDGREGRPDPGSLLAESDRDIPRIVLAHTTSFVGEASEAGVDLYLAGDTHGGQARLPAPVLRRLMPDKHWEYRDGVFRIGSLGLFVNHGIGWSILPFRLGYPPLVAVFRFEENP